MSESLGSITTSSIVQFISDHFSAISLLAMFFISAVLVYRRKKRSNSAHRTLSENREKKLDEPFSLHPEINPALCAGCGSCVKACPEGEILKLIRHKAAMVAPTKCLGHGECERACPYGAISLVFGTKTRGMDIPRITADYETNVPGLYIAGELAGMGLIRNAVKQGALAAEHALENLKPVKSSPDVIDLLIIGAGPAGLSASLKATEKKASYICIDQNSFGGTVYHFPRQKLVMTKPAILPVEGKMKFPKNQISKEELLAFWANIVRKNQLNIQENTRFFGLEKQKASFRVNTSGGEIFAQKVLLATGVRGTPRKLGVQNEDSPKVAYNLLEPEQYQNLSIAVVGAGNSALEAALMLSSGNLNNQVSILVRGEDMRKANEQNQKAVLDLVESGAIEIFFKTNLLAIEKDRILVSKDGNIKSIINHQVFIFAGTELPHKFLMSLGVKMDKKFGEALKNHA